MKPGSGERPAMRPSQMRFTGVREMLSRMQISKPKRVTRTFEQRLVAPPERVFPLLCPVREGDWIEGWDPLFVLSESGVAELDCVFATETNGRRAIWIVTRHDPPHDVEMVYVNANVTVCKLTIRLSTSPEGCSALVTYSHTSLGTEGDAFVASFTAELYTARMVDWETRLNYYLQTGECLRAR
jgi:hypothetical protein